MVNSDNGEERLSPRVRSLLLRFYPSYDPGYFEKLLISRTSQSSKVLEIGAGSGEGNQRHFDLRGRVARYVGIDCDPRVLNSPHLDEASVGRAENLPFDAQSFDLVFHSFVAEHLEAPEVVNREIARVLRPGGLLLFETPSRFYYPMLAARITPHWFHEFYVRNFGSGRQPSEIFPTFYRLNDASTIRRQLRACKLECEIQNLSTPPGYLRFSALSFLVGVLFERLFERNFRALRARIVVIAKKVS
jgi:SAM-dependent methyltransferase